MLLVFLRHGSVAALLAGVAAEVLAWLLGAVALQPVMIVLGALLFYLSEYGMHRFAFHAPPLSWPPARRLQHRLHYDHHVEPSQLDLLFLPIWFLVPNLAVAAGLFALVFGMQAAAPALLGMMLAILHYEWVHYVAHIPYQPRTQWAAGSSSTTFAIISSARSIGSASAIRRLTARSAHFADPAPTKKAPPPAISIPEAKGKGSGEGWGRNDESKERISQSG